MAAYKRKAVALRQGEAAAAYFLLDTAAVNHQGIPGYQMGMLLQPAGTAVGIDCKQNQITGGDNLFTELPVHSPRKHGKGQNGCVPFLGIDSVPGDGIGSGEGAANKPQT